MVWHEKFIQDVMSLSGSIYDRPRTLKELPPWERKRIQTHIDRSLSDLNELRAELNPDA
jgi:hypothetical protein